MVVSGPAGFSGRFLSDFLGQLRGIGGSDAKHWSGRISWGAKIRFGSKPLGLGIGRPPPEKPPVLPSGSGQLALPCLLVTRSG
jgi:hypothetical protein